MDVDSFIHKYRPDWDGLERGIRRDPSSLTGPELDELIRLYLRVSGHLAEAQGRYRDATLIAYLGGLVSRAHAAVYGRGARSVPDVVRAMTVRYRDAVRETAPFIVISTVLFLAVAVLAMIWVTNSPAARAGLLPPQTREALRELTGRRGELPLGSGALSTAILLNNIRVAILAFGLGISAGIGTVYVLVVNALLVGVLAGGAASVGKAGPFWAVVLPHGLLELTAIFISAGAGLRMGWALVAPGDRTRREALAEAAGRAVLVVTGVIPAFILAGLIEGFVSGTAVPTAVQLAVGISAWAGYVAFLAWPRRAGSPSYRRP